MNFKLTGSLRFRVQIVLLIIRSGIIVGLRRLLRGPLLPGWDLTFEASTHFQRALYQAVYRFQDIQDGRQLLDTIEVVSPSLGSVSIELVSQPVRGEWFRPKTFRKDRVILYCHGGYAFFGRVERSLVADLAQAAGIAVFAVDYRLTPENPYPAQVEDALACYEWLLGSGFTREQIIVFGSSAGGNLCLSLLLNLRYGNLPLPGLAIALSPWTDIGNSGESIAGNEPYDLLDRGMIEQGAEWFLGGQDPRDPLISPLYADLHGLPPLYLQAGGKELFIDMIRSFHQKAQDQGVNTVLDVWESMNHLFQGYGDRLPDSKDALQRIASLVNRKHLTDLSILSASEPKESVQ